MIGQWRRAERRWPKTECKLSAISLTFSPSRRQEEIQQVDPDVAHVEGVVRETAALRWPHEGEEDPTQAWAGECGVFADAVWREALKSGVEVEVVGLMGRFSDLPFEVTPPPGLSLQELTDFGVERALDHAW